MVYFSQKLEHPRFVQKKIQLEEKHWTAWESRPHSSAPVSSGREGEGGANCQKQPRSHICLRPSLIRTGGGGGIQKVYTYLMNRNTNILRKHLKIKLKLRSFSGNRKHSRPYFLWHFFAIDCQSIRSHMCLWPSGIRLTVIILGK